MNTQIGEIVEVPLKSRNANASVISRLREVINQGKAQNKVLSLRVSRKESFSIRNAAKLGKAEIKTQVDPDNKGFVYVTPISVPDEAPATVAVATETPAAPAPVTPAPTASTPSANKGGKSGKGK